MPIGFGTTFTVESLNQRLGDVAVTLRNACQEARYFWPDVDNLGVNGLMELGFHQNDAENFVEVAGYLNQIGDVFFGQANVPNVFDFDGDMSVRGQVKGGQ